MWTGPIWFRTGTGRQLCERGGKVSGGEFQCTVSFSRRTMFHAVSSNRIKHPIPFSSPNRTAYIPVKVRLFFSVPLITEPLWRKSRKLLPSRGPRKFDLLAEPTNISPKPWILNLLRPEVAFTFPYRMTDRWFINEVTLLKLTKLLLQRGSHITQHF
jgi:hypothetical protein